jgi:trehalose 6-phosphate phosphatase
MSGALRIAQSHAAMIDLFSPEGLAALERLSHQSTLYAFDFDGTLAPIVDRPDDASAQPSTVALLARLGPLVPTVLISGRSVDDVRQRIEFTPLHLIGNHGAEGLPDALHHSLADSVSANHGNAQHREIVQQWLEQWPAAIGDMHANQGIVVEIKSYSLSIHYRMAHDHEAARGLVMKAIAALDPQPRVIGGKCVFNLLPEGALDKGQALAALVRIEHCEAAFFIGDDVTDEAGFHDAPASWVTVRVGASGDSAARFFIEDQGDIDRCLETLLRNAEAAASSRASTRR